MSIYPSQKKVPEASPRINQNKIWLRRFSKLICFSTLGLIFAGGLVTSTGSGLSVPDWPLSYGTLFPPMVGGVRFEHTHRVIASIIGLFILTLTIWLGVAEKRRWVRNLSIGALGAVVLQGILGGLTVLFYLPKPISISHAVLAQTFFILTIILAYSQSLEQSSRLAQGEKTLDPGFLKACVTVSLLVYVQLIVGAVMRHTGAGLAILDFPTSGGHLIPRFNGEMLSMINNHRFELNLSPVTMGQVGIHFFHRALAFFVFIAVVYISYETGQLYKTKAAIFKLVFLLNLLVVAQITLGAITVLSGKSPLITSLHVMTGAAVLGVSVLLVLRAAPLSLLRTRQ